MELAGSSTTFVYTSTKAHGVICYKTVILKCTIVGTSEFCLKANHHEAVTGSFRVYWSEDNCDLINLPACSKTLRLSICRFSRFLPIFSHSSTSWNPPFTHPHPYTSVSFACLTSAAVISFLLLGCVPSFILQRTRELCTPNDPHST